MLGKGQGDDNGGHTDFGLSKAVRLLPNYNGKDEPASANGGRETAGDAVKRKLQ